MKRTYLFSGQLLIWIILLTALPAWSDSGKKLPVPNAVMNGASKGVDQNGSAEYDTKRNEKNESEKGGASIKNKVVKKVGTAAAAGVAGKRVMSKISDSN